MPYIPDEEKARLKREVSIERLAEARGVKLKRVGKNLMGLCPFHQDTNPSLSIDPVKNEWHCFGACNKGGDVIEWVKHAEGVSFTHAVELLKRDFLPFAARSAGPPPKKSTVPKLPPLLEHTTGDKRLLEIVVSYYHQTLKESPEAQQYLLKRGLRSAEMVEHFRLGFANRTLGYHLPASNRVAGEEQRGRLKQLGVFRDNGREHLRGSLVIPIFDASGQVVQMYGRKITPRHALREDTPEHLYLPGAHRGVWNEEALGASKEIILCEALIDALTFWCAGFRHVTASYGVNGFTDDHRAAFKKYGMKKVHIAYDRDDAGERAAQELAEELLAMGIDCYRVQFPKGMDANEYALKVQPAAKSLGILLNKAAWLGKGQRPIVAVSEPTPAATEEKPEAAAKEKILEAAPIAASEEAPVPTLDALTVESDLPFAAESSATTEETAPVATMPVLSPSTPDVPTEIIGDEITILQGDRRYRVRGLGKNMSYELLKVNVLVHREPGESLSNASGFHVDTLDLYSARQRTAFTKQAAEELGVKEEVIRRDLGSVLRKLEELQDRQIKNALEPKEEKIQLSEDERAAALDLLRDPKLLDRVLADFEKCGMVGEETNKTISYLAAVSRLMETPLAILVQSSSAAGKTALMEAVLAMLPEEQQVQYSAMTGQALFYLGETELKNKVLAVVEEEGTQRAAYALKLLQSEGVLTIASTGKDATTGRLITHQYRVEGPVMLFLTTTAIEMDEELLNRCIVLTVNEAPEQTKAIHQKQREAQTRAGLWAREERREILKLHRNAQRLLRPLRVANEHAPSLSFPFNRTRTRRDHTKFLTLINAIALLYQYQRPIQTDTRNGKTIEYIEATEQDVELACQLVNQVLPPSLDEVPPQTRRLLVEIEKMVSEECARQKIERSDYRFSRRMVRHYTQAGDSVLKKHLHRLEELEYLIVHRGGRGQSFVYELDFELNEHGNPVVPGLGWSYDGKKSHPNGQLSPSSHAQVAGMPQVVTIEETRASTGENGDFRENPEKLTVQAAKENRIVRTAAQVRRARASGGQ